MTFFWLKTENMFHIVCSLDQCHEQVTLTFHLGKSVERNVQHAYVKGWKKICFKRNHLSEILRKILFFKGLTYNVNTCGSKSKKV